MSRRVHTWGPAVFSNRAAKGSNRLVLFALALMADHTGLARPTADELCRVTLLCRRQIFASLAWLVTNGALEVVFRGGGREKATIYRLKGFVPATVNSAQGPTVYESETVHEHAPFTDDLLTRACVQYPAAKDERKILRVNGSQLKRKSG